MGVKKAFLVWGRGGVSPIGVNLSQKYLNKRKKRGHRPSGGKVKAFITLLAGGSLAPVSASYLTTTPGATASDHRRRIGARGARAVTRGRGPASPRAQSLCAPARDQA